MEELQALLWFWYSAEFSYVLTIQNKHKKH